MEVQHLKYRIFINFYYLLHSSKALLLSLVMSIYMYLMALITLFKWILCTLNYCLIALNILVLKVISLRLLDELKYESYNLCYHCWIYILSNKQMLSLLAVSTQKLSNNKEPKNIHNSWLLIQVNMLKYTLLSYPSKMLTTNKLTFLYRIYANALSALILFI